MKKAIIYTERVQVLPNAWITILFERIPPRGNRVYSSHALVGVEIDGIDMSRHWMGKGWVSSLAWYHADARLWARRNAGKETLRARTAYGAEVAYRAATGRPLEGSGMAYRVEREAAGLTIGLDVWRAWCPRSPEKIGDPGPACEVWAKDGDAEIMRRFARWEMPDGIQWHRSNGAHWLDEQQERVVRMAADAVLG